VIWPYRIAAVAGAIIIATTSFAHAVTIMGSGSGDCGSWINNENNPIAASSQIDWILGFLSALVATSSDGIDFLSGQSSAGISLAVHNYCVAHPTGWIENAAFDVANQLIGQHRPLK
jgi:hypothetical protein